LRSIQLIAGVLGRAGEEGQRLRLEAAKTGVVTWQTPRGLSEVLNPEKKGEFDSADEKILTISYGDENLRQNRNDRPPRRRAAGLDDDVEDL
jgi:small subunit ribosomal protein S2